MRAVFPYVLHGTSAPPTDHGAQATPQKGSKSRNTEGALIFFLSISLKSTYSALHKDSGSAFQGCFYSKINKDMTPGADVSLMYLPRWEARGTIYAWYSLSASSSPAQLQVPDALGVKVGRNRASPEGSTFLLLNGAVMVPAVITVMSSHQIYAGQFIQFSLSRGEKGIIHKHSMQGARREVEAYVVIWQRTD